MHRGHLAEEAALAAVRALVEDEPCLARDQAAVMRRAGLELHHDALAALGDRPELLLAREDELHGTPGRARERGDLCLEVQIALRAEAAPEQWDHDPDVRLGDLQGLRDTGPCGVRHLRRGPDRDLVAPPLGHDGPGSIGTPCDASDSYRPETTTSAAAIAASASPLTMVWYPIVLPSERISSSRAYDAQSGWTSTAPGSIAATKSVTTGSGS